MCLSCDKEKKPRNSNGTNARNCRTCSKRCLAHCAIDPYEISGLLQCRLVAATFGMQDRLTQATPRPGLRWNPHASSFRIFHQNQIWLDQSNVCKWFPTSQLGKTQHVCHLGHHHLPSNVSQAAWRIHAQTCVQLASTSEAKTMPGIRWSQWKIWKDKTRPLATSCQTLKQQSVTSKRFAWFASDRRKKGGDEEK